MKIIAKQKSTAITTIPYEKIQIIRDTIKDKNCYLTCANRVDGVGAQAWASISTLIVARFLGFHFIYTLLLNVDHNDLDINKREWTKEWDDILQIKNISQQGDKKKIVKRELMDWGDVLRKSNDQLKVYFKPNTCYIVKQSHDIVNVFYNELEMKNIICSMLGELQTLFKFKSDNISEESCKKIVAIHIRKGDVTELKITKRITPNTYFINLIKHLQKTNDQYEFHIYSEGSIQKDFPEFKLKNKNDKYYVLSEDENVQTQIHLNGDARETFKQLVLADVLVTSKSCFSYVAAILNKNTILFTKFWFPKLNEKWIELNDDGTTQSVLM